MNRYYNEYEQRIINTIKRITLNSFEKELKFVNNFIYIDYNKSVLEYIKIYNDNAFIELSGDIFYKILFKTYLGYDEEMKKILYNIGYNNTNIIHVNLMNIDKNIEVKLPDHKYQYMYNYRNKIRDEIYYEYN